MGTRLCGPTEEAACSLNSLALAPCATVGRLPLYNSVSVNSENISHQGHEVSRIKTGDRKPSWNFVSFVVVDLRALCCKPRCMNDCGNCLSFRHACRIRIESNVRSARHEAAQSTRRSYPLLQRPRHLRFLSPANRENTAGGHCRSNPNHARS